MKKSLFYIGIFCFSAAVSGCGEKKKESQTLEPGIIPPAVASLIIGDDFAKDTLYSSDAGSYVYIDNPDYCQHILYGPDGLIFNSPTASIDSITPERYTINNSLGSYTVDFALPVSVSSLKAVYPQYKGFDNLKISDVTTSGQKAVYSFTVDVPTREIKNYQAITNWLKTCVEDSADMNMSLKQLGESIMKEYVAKMKKPQSQFTFYNNRSVLLYEMSDDYVTYQDWWYGFSGGAHGMYANRFVSFDQKTGAPVTTESLIKPDCEDTVRELIYEAIASDEDFMTKARLTSLSQVKSYINSNLQGEVLPIPTPGLTRQGVVFCYQPYEIGPYSDGAFQLVVPYDKIKNYINI